MRRILEDGLDAYVIMEGDAALGWISRSHWHGKWRALSVKTNRVTFHLTRMGAIDAIIGRA